MTRFAVVLAFAFLAGGCAVGSELLRGGELVDARSQATRRVRGTWEHDETRAPMDLEMAWFGGDEHIEEWQNARRYGEALTPAHGWALRGDIAIPWIVSSTRDGKLRLWTWWEEARLQPLLIDLLPAENPQDDRLVLRDEHGVELAYEREAAWLLIDGEPVSSVAIRWAKDYTEPTAVGAYRIAAARLGLTLPVARADFEEAEQSGRLTFRDDAGREALYGLFAPEARAFLIEPAGGLAYYLPDAAATPP